MSFLSYKVVRGTCLRFPEQLEVVVTGDVLQQRLPACSVALTVLLAAGAERERSLSKYNMGRMWRMDVYERVSRVRILHKPNSFLTHLPGTFPSAPY